MFSLGIDLNLKVQGHKKEVRKVAPLNKDGRKIYRYCLDPATCNLNVKLTTSVTLFQSSCTKVYDVRSPRLPCTSLFIYPVCIW